MRYRMSPFTCAIPCHACDRPEPAIWNEEPFPGHNLGTLYECRRGAVFSLADATASRLTLDELPDHGRKAVKR